LRLALGLVLPVLALGAVLRCVLYAEFHDGSFSIVTLAAALAAGAGFDLLDTVAALTPVLCVVAAFRLRWLERPRVRGVLLALFFTLIAFDVVAQYYFFEEFNARYNHIALDYLIYPNEVLGNIWESYNVPLVVGLSLGAGSALSVLVSRRLGGLTLGPWPWRARAVAVGAVLGAGTVAGLLLSVLPADITSNRITNEVAQNGLGQLVRAFRTAELDYASYYTVLPRDEARARAARVLGFDAPSPELLDAPPGVFRVDRECGPAAGSGSESHLDVVVVLEESLGSNFVGVLGGVEHSKDGSSLTPSLDRWSRDGLLLTNLVANGNRTVRGLEGVLCSFVPLPGDSIVKRTRTDVASLARVFDSAGYATCFLYGGYGIFDRMKPFMTQNGWDEFIEQPDFPDDAFRTAWGVADEYIFDALLARQLQAQTKGERLFATLMSVSNHRPYDVPPGRIDLPRSRLGAVKYSDWAIGRYLDQARAAGVLDHTVVLFVGDHGARVYGAEQIPVASYRIPGLFLAPGDALRGRTFDRLCSQIDLAPTLLGIAGVSAATPFLGRDLLANPDAPGRAFVNHNHEIGMLTDDALVVLGLNRATAYYRRAGVASSELVRVKDRDVTPAMRELHLDAAAVFQTADELFRSGAYTFAPRHMLGARAR
jgi:phosphoglycerol transferase MdoB-like AlkP superfamily enzyme